MSNLSQLPIVSGAPDQLREGIGASATAGSTLAPHPVALVESRWARQQEANKKMLLSRIYGTHMPMQMHVEQTLLSQFRRPAGLPSSHLGLSVLMGHDEDIDWGDVQNRPENSEAQYDPISEMEHRMTGEAKRRVF